MSFDYPLGIVWMRRDLRLHDHAALSMATKQCQQVLVVFNFDQKILNELKANPSDQRISFIIQSLQEVEESLQQQGSSLLICHGDPTKEIPKICEKYKAKVLYFNEDYSPYAIARDQNVMSNLWNQKIAVEVFKDHVVFSPGQVLKADSTPYLVFTPYKNAWLNKFSSNGKVLPDYKINKKRFYQWSNSNSILNDRWYKKLGMQKVIPYFRPGTKEAFKRLRQFHQKIDQYEMKRDYPAIDGTSHLSTYIRFGNVSVRDLMKEALSGQSKGHQIWLSELIWREFYQMIAYHFPHVQGGCFRKAYEKIKWKGGQKEFNAWKEGQTGFPIVDAAMRCFKETGTMHNRLRMVVASFLCKTLLVDWKKGERYFAKYLLDYDFAANNGGWQWSSSTGCDAQPYFRIFNPTAQSKKFDVDGIFIKKWVPELNHPGVLNIHQPTYEDCMLTQYPLPVVDYKKNRQTALTMYKSVLR